MLLHDPEGLAERLRQEARDWNWRHLDARCDGRVAEQIVGLRWKTR